MKKSIVLLLSLLALGLFLGACGAAPDSEAPEASDAPPPVFRFSAIPDQNTTETAEKIGARIRFF